MVILITGASRGIGAALAKELAVDKHALLLVSRNRQRLQEVADECNRISGSGNAYPIQFDLNDLDNLGGEFISLLKKHTDRIDALVNNAGYLIRKPFLDFSQEEVREIFSANVYAPASLIRLTVPFLKRSELAHIVNITSMSGYQGSKKFSGLSYYGASKAALASLTEYLAEELREDGIKVNGLALGAVGTEMFATAFPGFEAPLDASDMAKFLTWFTLEGHRYFNGKHLPVTLGTP